MSNSEHKDIKKATVVRGGNSRFVIGGKSDGLFFLIADNVIGISLERAVDIASDSIRFSVLGTNLSFVHHMTWGDACEFVNLFHQWQDGMITGACFDIENIFRIYDGEKPVSPDWLLDFGVPEKWLVSSHHVERSV